MATTRRSLESATLLLVFFRAYPISHADIAAKYRALGLLLHTAWRNGPLENIHAGEFREVRSTSGG